MLRLLLTASLLLGLTLAATAQDEPHPIAKQVKEKLKDPAKPFTMGIRAKLKAGTAEQFEAAFAPAIKETRKEKGCIAYDLNKSADDETIYVVYERWASLAALEAHLKTPHTQKLLSTIHDYLDGAPEVRVFLPAAE